ncbi:response regulator [Halioxenophilus aromaticivorans]|uniref:Response regulator n=1 Tax=Halioxenophilus aromaticivorans TaxID=1306992 RepID=A0AAV3U3Q7_9ALTE
MKSNVERLLLVDDNKADRESVRRALRSLQVSSILDVAEDGAQALEHLLKSPTSELPDVIIMDVNMPIMTGDEALTKIRQSERLRHIPVVFLTANDKQSQVMSGYKNGINAYLIKPANASGYRDLMARVQEFWLEAVVLPR